jgi:hypothetical protein
MSLSTTDLIISNSETEATSKNSEDYKMVGKTIGQG